MTAGSVWRWMFAALFVASAAQAEDIQVIRLLDRDVVTDALRPAHVLPIRGEAKCAYGGREAIACRVASDTKCFVADFASPYPLAEMGDFGACPRANLIVEWLPAAEVSGAETYRRRVQDLLDGKTQCALRGDSECWEALKSNRVAVDGRDAEAILVCRRLHVAGYKGAPEGCRMAVMEVGGREFYPAVRAIRLPSTFGAVPDERIVLYSTSPLDLGAAVSAIRFHLQQDPFGLTTDPRLAAPHVSRHSKSVVGVAGPRYSYDMRAWEQVTVRMLQFAPESPQWFQHQGTTFEEQAEYEISYSLLVNAQATSSPKDWTLPTEDQRKHFLNRLRFAVGMGLETLCSSADWPNGTTMLCRGKPE